MNCRTLTENHPDRGLVTNTYDKSSNLISMNRASIGAIDFGYSYNRLTSRTMPGSTGNDLYDVTYTYGAPGDGKNGAGRIVTIDQGQGFKVDHYSYDELGQRVVEQSTIQVPQVGQRTYQTQFKYSSFGRILQASYPDGDVVNYHYTDKGELFSIESTAPGEPKLFVVQETQYNGFGQIGTLIYGNGTKTTYNYASSDFVTSGLGHLNKTALFTATVEGKATLGGATTSLVSRDYQYSNLGMVNSLNKSIHSTLAAGITSLDYSFSYDDKGRLLGSTLATGGMNIYELTMGYNAVGGITSKDSDLPNGGHPLVNPNLKYDLSYSYNPAKPHQLLSVTEVGPNGGITNFSYDDVGNLTESFGPSGTEELIWNELQQLSGVMNGNGIHHYVYDHNGERIMKSSINRSWVQVNDQNVDDIQYLEPYTLYVNPYYVVTSFHNGDHISKHYYMNTQRVATDISINYQGPPPPIAPGAPMSSDSAQSTGMGISASFEDDLNKILQQFDAGDLTSSLSENGVTMEKYYPNAASESESINRILYWYHPDYLGSVDLVTDRNGVAYEFFLYTPWGEDMYSYNSGTSNFTSPYRFNGKEKDPETGYGYYGARYYQSKFSVWMSVDRLARKYPSLTPYNFVANNPINAIDPDGNVIIFINGMQFGDGGSRRYWNGLDTRIKNRVGDYKARYYDGSSGGGWNTFWRPIWSRNTSPRARRLQGRDMAYEQAAKIFNNLEEGETIKIATHSMGGAYGKGFIQGLRKYAEENDIDIEGLIEFEVDLAPYQPTRQEAQEGVRTIVVAHDGDAVAGSSTMPGAENNVTRKDESWGTGEHSVDSFNQSEIDQFVPKSNNNPIGSGVWEEKPENN